MFVLSFFEFEARFLKTEFCFFSKCLSVRFISKMHFDVFQNVCPFVFLQTAFAFFFEKFVHSFFLKSLSFSLFFYQIFSSQIISKTCRRTKGKCPFVFWIHSSISLNFAFFRHPAVILSTARIVNVQIDAYDLVLRSAALFKLRWSPLPKSFSSVALAECILVKEVWRHCTNFSLRCRVVIVV